MLQFRAQTALFSPRVDRCQDRASQRSSVLRVACMMLQRQLRVWKWNPRAISAPLNLHCEANHDLAATAKLDAPCAEQCGADTNENMRCRVALRSSARRMLDLRARLPGLPPGRRRVGRVSKRPQRSLVLDPGNGIGAPWIGSLITNLASLVLLLLMFMSGH